ncbi:hypothetical protein JMJ35_006877 [Cladonia borealis]|uniref:Uncharacterized protein n=1 Tax=Cladonia borealis TaxID=184061 RepID=A0AA39QWF7_9LECA|nr:hypothetical protein JMJ35_006877 [Cladonia borealis]
MLSPLSLPLAFVLSIYPLLSTSTEINHLKRAAAEPLARLTNPALFIRQGAACPSIDPFDWDMGEDGGSYTGPAYTPPTSSLFNAASETAAASSAIITTSPTLPTCTLQNEDPDQNINTPYCICTASGLPSSKTYPVLSVAPTAQESASCAYTTLPATAASISISTPVITSNCQVCTQVVNNEADCTPIPSCRPTSNTVNPVSTPTGTPSTKVEISNNTVHAGELSGSKLYSAALSVMSPACPTPSGNNPTSCSSSGQGVQNVGFVEDGDASAGTLVFTIEDSNYTTVGQRNAMLGAAAQAFANAATHKSCQNMTFAGDCPSSRKMMKRDDLSPAGSGALEPRVYTPPPECTHELLVCDTTNLVTVLVLDENGLEAFMNVEASFAIAGFNLFDCEAMLDFLVVALEEVAPEVVLSDWELLGEIMVLCEELTGQGVAVSKGRKEEGGTGW